MSFIKSKNPIVYVVLETEIESDGFFENISQQLNRYLCRIGTFNEITDYQERMHMDIKKPKQIVAIKRQLNETVASLFNRIPQTEFCLVGPILLDEFVYSTDIPLPICTLFIRNRDLSSFGKRGFEDLGNNVAQIISDFNNCVSFYNSTGHISHDSLKTIVYHSIIYILSDTQITNQAMQTIHRNYCSWNTNTSFFCNEESGLFKAFTYS